jgi:hypothetical protein
VSQTSQLAPEAQRLFERSMLDRIDLPQGTLDLLILRTLAQRHPGKVSVAPTQAFFKTTERM